MLTHSFDIPFEPFRIVWSSPYSTETRIAVSSFNKSLSNDLKILKFTDDSIIEESEAKITYPICDLKFLPGGCSEDMDRLISCGDNLKLWQTFPDKCQLISDIPTSTEKVPLTTLDWSTFQESLILVGGADGAATAVDVSCGQIAAKIIAHDHPIHDICFCGQTPTFVTASFDGSLRFFDLRDLQSSFIYYQTSMPLMQIDVSPFDSNYIASFSKESNAVTIIDTRHPGIPVYVCEYEESPVSCIGWSKGEQNSIVWSSRDSNLLAADLEDSMRPPPQIISNTEAPIECFSIFQNMIGMTLSTKVDVIQYEIEVEADQDDQAIIQEQQQGQ